MPCLSRPQRLLAFLTALGLALALVPPLAAQGVQTAPSARPQAAPAPAPPAAPPAPSPTTTPVAPVAAPAAARQTAVQPAFVLLPPSLRAGDPLLAWIKSPAALEGATVELLDSTGRRIGQVQPFEYPAPAATPSSPAPSAVSAAPTTAPSAAPASPGATASPPAAGSTSPAPSSARLYGALFALPFDAKAGEWRLVLRRPWSPGAAGQAAASGPPPEIEARLSVQTRAFPAEDIGLDAANTALRTVPDPKKEAEARAFAELLSRVDPGAVHLDSGLVLPVGEARRSAGFGDERRYLYSGGGSESSRHLGVDFAVVKGTPVRAAARGRVVFAAERIVTGTTVVIEHLPGLYSIYMHLSSASVAAGRLVERGEVVALSGNSGLSTGPHLHWELRALGRSVDPEAWVKAAPLDKARLIAIIDAAIEGR